MFEICKIHDTFGLEPAELGADRDTMLLHIKKKVIKRDLNKLVEKLGLCVAVTRVYALDEHGGKPVDAHGAELITDETQAAKNMQVHYGTGNTRIVVEIDLLIFKPMPKEIVKGFVQAQSREGV